MNQRNKQLVLLSAVLLMGGGGYGQQAAKNTTETVQAQPQASAEGSPAERNFQLIFTARELDENGKILNARRFDTTVTTGSPKKEGVSNIRSGVRIPVSTSPPGQAIQTQTQFTYVDVGANFDVNDARVVKGNRLAMVVSAQISSADIVTAERGQVPVRQNQWMGGVEIPIGGKKVIFSSDDLTSKKRLEIELAVVPVDR